MNDNLSEHQLDEDDGRCVVCGKKWFTDRRPRTCLDCLPDDESRQSVTLVATAEELRLLLNSVMAENGRLRERLSQTLEVEKELAKAREDNERLRDLISRMREALHHTEETLWKALESKSFRDGPHLSSRNEALMKESLDA